MGNVTLVNHFGNYAQTSSLLDIDAIDGLRMAIDKAHRLEPRRDVDDYRSASDSHRSQAHGAQGQQEACGTDSAPL
jgi:hypothetical protein